MRRMQRKGPDRSLRINPSSTATRKFLCCCAWRVLGGGNDPPYPLHPPHPRPTFEPGCQTCAQAREGSLDDRELARSRNLASCDEVFHHHRHSVRFPLE